MPLPDSDDEPLEEIEDDAIVAQQAAAHAPAPRVPIAQDARTIVVDEGAATAGDTTRLRAIPRRPMDPTLVVRAVRYPVVPSAPPGPPVPAPPARGTPSWLPWVIWGCAGIVALVLGGVLAVVANRRDAQPAVSPTPPPSAAKPVVTR
ncbi:MAG: hypothetical protein HYZ29_13490 [Myxococcales bacterium]|nr:hypothetical protein [Myxococcales bacterium]